MELVNEKDNKFVFKAEIEESLANAIRRYIEEILILAVEDVEISKNDSPLYDETIAHRIGLTPLKAENVVTEKTEGKLKLGVKKEGIVNSEELRGDFDVVYGNIPITILSKGQELELVANVKPGRGSKHARFSPGLMFYRNASEITMDKEFAAEIKKTFPKNEIKDKGNKLVIIDDKEKEILDFCEGICERAGKKSEINYGKELIVSLESFGQMNVRDIFKKSIDVLKKDLAEISKKLK